MILQFDPSKYTFLSSFTVFQRVSLFPNHTPQRTGPTYNLTYTPDAIEVSEGGLQGHHLPSNAHCLLLLL